MPHACHGFWKCSNTLTLCSLLTRCTIPCACQAKRHLNVQKWSEPRVFLKFWLRNVLRATTACTFRHLNVQKWSEPLVFLKIWLRNVLRATTACTFSTSERPKVVRTVLCATTACTFSTSQLPRVLRTWGAFSFFTCKCASRHNGVHFFDISTSKTVRTWGAFSFFTCKCASRHSGVHFFISHLARWLAPAALASLLFDPPEPQIIGENTVFRDFPTFSRIWASFFWFFLFSDLLSSSLLSDSSRLCFSSVHIVGSLTLNFLRY